MNINGSCQSQKIKSRALIILNQKLGQVVDKNQCLVFQLFCFILNDFQRHPHLNHESVFQLSQFLNIQMRPLTKGNILNLNVEAHEETRKRKNSTCSTIEIHMNIIPQEKRDCFSEVNLKKQKNQHKEYTFSKNDPRQAQIFLQRPRQLQNQQNQFFKKKKKLEKQLLNSSTIIEVLKKNISQKKKEINQKREEELLVSKIKRKNLLIRLTEEQQFRIQNNLIMAIEQKVQIQEGIKTLYQLQINQVRKSHQNDIERFEERQINTIYKKYFTTSPELNQGIMLLSCLTLDEKKQKILDLILKKKYERNKIKTNQIKKQRNQRIKQLKQELNFQQNQLKKEGNEIFLQIKEKRKKLISSQQQLKNQENQGRRKFIKYQIQDVQKELLQLSDKFNFKKTKIKQLEDRMPANIAMINVQNQLPIRGVINLQKEWQEVQKQKELYITNNNQQLKIEKKRVQRNRQESINRLNKCYTFGQDLTETETDCIQETRFFKKVSPALYFQLRQLEENLYQIQSIQTLECLVTKQLNFYRQTKQKIHQLRHNRDLRLNSQYLEIDKNKFSYTVNTGRGNTIVQQERFILKEGNLKPSKMSSNSSSKINSNNPNQKKSKKKSSDGTKPLWRN